MWGSLPPPYCRCVMRQRINAAEHAQCLHRRLLVNTSLHPLLLCPCWLLQVRNWPSSRGSVVGTMKASIGLSGACLLLQHLLQLHCFKHACVRAYAPAGGRARAASGHRDTPAHSSPPTPLADARPPCSGSLFACIYSGAFAPDSARFLLFLALAPVAVGLLALPFINHCSFVQQSELEAGQHVFTAE